MSELTAEAFAALRAAEDVGSLTAVVATVDADGKPHAAPFGSVYAVSPAALRFGCDRGHDTFANLRREGRIVVSVLLPPAVAISVSGRAVVIKEAMECSAADAVVEVVIELVKDDMLAGASIESGVTYAVPAEVRLFVERYYDEVREASR